VRPRLTAHGKAKQRRVVIGTPIKPAVNNCIGKWSGYSERMRNSGVKSPSAKSRSRTLKNRSQT
jgi:hypothetical protein